MKIYKLTIICILLASKGYSSVFHDSSVSKPKIRPLFIYTKDIENFRQTSNTFDTTLHNFQFINPIRKRNLSFQNLGLPGTPQKNYFIDKLKDPGFDLGFNNMDIWLINCNEENDKIVYSPTPYSSLNYSQGEKDLIFIEASHTQNINSRINAGIDYRRIKTNNYLFFNFDNQEYNRVRIPNIYNLKLYTSYRAKNDKIYIIGNIIFNKSTLRESGGLKYPEMFDTTSGKLRAFENNLKNANNSIKQYATNIKTYYRFGNTKFIIKQKDSSLKDTTGLMFIPKSYLFHNIYISHSRYYYTDPNTDTPYYSVSYFGKGVSDSIVFKEISNSLGLAFKSKNLILKTNVVLSNYGVYNKFYGQQVFHNIAVKCDLSFAKDNKNLNFNYGINTNYFLSGYNKNDYLIKAFIDISKQGYFGAIADVFSQQNSPDYVQNLYFSNHAIWNQKLDKTLRNGFSLNIKINKLNTTIDFAVCNFNNYILYYKNTSPSSIDFTYISADIENKLKLKKIKFENRIVFQKTSKTYNVPLLILNGQLFYENFLFKKNMFARIGIDYNWNSNFFADFYIPYLRQYVWQNEIKTGNYPYVGLFFSASVQTVNFFIKFEHINQGILGSNYYNTYLYPEVPRFFSMGIKWRLFY